MMVSVSQIAECLTATLNPDTTTRITAELRLAEYFSVPDAGLALSQLILAQNADMPLRQTRPDLCLDQHSASITLRKYVKERWSPFFPTFKGSAPSVEIKAQIRQSVFNALSDKDRKIRTLCAYTLSSIANCDWPDEYPGLLTSLIELLASGSPDSIHGAMQVFTEFIKSDLTEDQILPVLRQLLPVLLSVLGSREPHSALTRARTVSVFQQCVVALFMVKDQHPQAVKEATASVLPVWLEAFKVLLSIDPLQDINSNWDGLAVRIQVIKTLDAIHTSFPKSLTPYVQDFLSLSLHHLQVLYPAFVRYYISSSESVPRTSEDAAIELPQLICPIIDLISALSRGGGNSRTWLENGHVDPLINNLFNYAQMTDEDEETWATNPNLFVAQEEDETQPYSIRVAAFEVLNCLLDRVPTQAASTYQSIFNQVVQSSQQARESGMSNWWRPLEAALAALGSQAHFLIDYIEDDMESGRPKTIDIEPILANVIPSILSLIEVPFLQGRGFVFASLYSKFLPLELAGRYLEAALQVLETSEISDPVKVSAVKAVHNFFQGGEDSALIPFAPRIAKDLGPFVLSTSEDTLSLVLEALSVVIELDQGKWLTQELASSLVVAVLEVWHKNNKDPIFISILTDILESLAACPVNGIYEMVVKQSLPGLVKAIATADKEESWIAGSAIQFISSLVKGSSPNSLGDGFFALIASDLFKCLSEAEDRDVLQNGIECLTLIIRKDCNQLLSWSDANGQSGLHHVLSFVARTLNSEDESGGLVIGDLIIHLFRKAGDTILPVLPEMLQAMVSRMTSAKTATFLQSLIIPFAFLINNQRDTVLTLLESMNVGNRSGLDILIQTWCENAETFQGFWPSRVSTLALTQLYVSERPSLQNLIVKGDIILKHETNNVIMTRSRTKKTPHEFTSISFPVKALKIIVHDLQMGGEAATISAQGGVRTSELDSDDGDNDWAEDEDRPGFKEEEFAFLSELIGPKGMAFDNDDILDDNDDEDLKNDPVSQMDMQGHLVSFLRECAAHNTGNFSAVAEQLATEEILVLRRAIESR